MTKLEISPRVKNRDFSVYIYFDISMLEQALSNLIVCEVISQKLHTKVAQTSKQVSFFTNFIGNETSKKIKLLRQL